MRKLLLYISLPALMLMTGTVMTAAEPDDGETTVTEDDTSDIRENPVTIPDGDADDIDIPVPSFIRQNVNRIALNGSDPAKLRNAVLGCNRQPVSMLLIGDSHVQAGINSGVTRELLLYDFGNAGRGLVAPLRLSGTHEPSDYYFQSRNQWNAVRLMNASWEQSVGFTGTSIHPLPSDSQLFIATSEKEDYNPFTALTIFHRGQMSIKSVSTAEGKQLHFRAVPSRDYTHIILAEPVTGVDIEFSSAGDLTVYGASLDSGRPGIRFHSIGNNGATYDTYNRIGNVGQGIAPLEPALIMIALGTNEAFGKFDSADFTRSIDRLVKNIRATNPDAFIVLSTPMECQRSITTSKKVRVKGKTRKGRPRYRTTSVKSYKVNSNIALARNAILDYGRKNHIAVYDWYDVAGGSGASSSWISANLFAKDRVHHTAAGYRLEGRMLYDAILSTLRD
ncbi:MAG: hypothetical protein K2H98_08185 [Duncaniella sp.]|nr:hypothetical protein [Duncaniella sp.]